MVVEERDKLRRQKEEDQGKVDENDETLAQTMSLMEQNKHALNKAIQENNKLQKDNKMLKQMVKEAMKTNSSIAQKYKSLVTE